MAEAEGEYVHGSMNIEAQRETYGVFWTVTKWASILIAITLVLLATMRTNAIDCSKAEQAAAHINSCGKLPGAAEADLPTDPTISTAPPESARRDGPRRTRDAALMKIAVLRERRAQEKRVAASPETVKKYVGLGASVDVEAGAGEGSRIPDRLYVDAGATIVPNAAAAVAGADIILKVQRPEAEELKGARPEALVIGLLSPYEKEALGAVAGSGQSFLAMEFVPRISRAQAMDALSSQANLSGYKAVIDAAAEFSRAMPMMMTAAGTVAPARVFVFGAGVAGLQAIATARRLGAIVSATDVRPAAKEQVESLGGTFVAVIDDEFKQAETATGYAKPMSAEYQAKQAVLIAETIKKQDIAICTALIPGRKAPVLITAEMVHSMKPGSIIVDLAVEQGGNCPLSKPGEIVDVGGVQIMGHINVPSRIAQDSSNLYAKNLLNLVTLLIDKSTKELNVPWDDEIVKGALVAKGGAIVHPQLLA